MGCSEMVLKPGSEMRVRAAPVRAERSEEAPLQSLSVHSCDSPPETRAHWSRER